MIVKSFQKCIFVLGLALFLSTSLFAFNISEGSDTIQAFVVNTNSNSFPFKSDLSGTELIHLIDSLLDEDKLPVELVQQINSVAAQLMREDNSMVSLTGFYDDSPFPSNSFYNSWDNFNMHPIVNDGNEQDNYSLVLQDTLNFCNFYPPIQGVVTSNYGWRNGRSHQGMDIDLEVLDPIHASFDGMVRVSRFHPAYGRVVVIRHYNGLETLYAHMHRLKVQVGDVVEAGQVIGLGGSSGRSTGSHLHFEVRFRGKPINPRNIISFKDYSLISDSVELVKSKWNSYQCYPRGKHFYIVQKGDFLSKIANQYGTTVQRICEINGINSNKTLSIGKRLIIE